MPDKTPRMRVCSGRFDIAEFHPQVIFFGDDETDCPCCRLLRRIEEIKTAIQEREAKGVKP